MTNEAKVPTRMGDGTFTQLTRSEIRADLIAGSEAATKRAKVPLLTDDEIDHLLEIYASPVRFIGVDVGEEIVLSCDGTGMKTHATRIQDLQSYEQWMGADLLELCVGDYSLKVVRTILAVRGPVPARRAAAARSPRCSTASCPTWASTPSRTARARTGTSCCRWARSPRRGRPPKRRSRWPSSTW